MIVPSLRGGGLERATADLSLSLRELGFHVEVFALNGLGEHAERLGSMGIRCHDIRRLGPRLRGYPAGLIRALRQFAPDIIHSHSGTWFPSAVAKTILRTPRLFYTEHGRYPPEPLTRAVVERWCASRSDSVIAVSEAAADYLQTFLRLPSRPKVIENGVAIDAYVGIEADRVALRAQWELTPEHVAFLAVGRFAPVKNHVLMLNAFASAVRTAPSIRLLLAGSGPLEEDLRELARALGVDGHVTFLGFRRDIVKCLNAADAFVISSTTEGLPISLLEAMASRLPVIATAVGGIPDAIGSPPCGVLVPSGDQEALAGAFRAFGADLALREKYAALAEANVRRYSLGRCIEAHRILYTEHA